MDSIEEAVSQNLDRFKSFQTKFASACRSANRNPAEIKVVLVTKTVSLDVINHTVKVILEEGLLTPQQIILGENKVQEAFNKFSAWKSGIVSDSQKFERHFIGHLQTNKAGKIIPLTQQLHSLDRNSLLEKLSSLHQNNPDQFPTPLKAFIQVNVAGEENKSGLAIDEVFEFYQQATEYPWITVNGLMTMAPLEDDNNLSRATDTFKKLAKLKDQINDTIGDIIDGTLINGTHRGKPLTELSMGMTHDFEVAIREGATMIRVGSGIFGSRHYP